MNGLVCCDAFMLTMVVGCRLVFRGQDDAGKTSDEYVIGSCR